MSDKAQAVEAKADGPKMITWERPGKDSKPLVTNDLQANIDKCHSLGYTSKEYPLPKKEK